jgi:hypothetical protein
MQFKFLIIPAAFMFQLAVAQNSPATMTLSQGTATAPVSAPYSASVTITENTASPASPASDGTLIVDYKSVYETASAEEEVKLAAERFKLTQAQQEVWLLAATDRREAEKQAQVKLDSKVSNYEKEPAYKGLRSAQNTFYETVVGYLAPAQKQALETDRLIIQERQRRLAKLPPPAPTVTVVPVDSTAIKQAEKDAKAEKAKGAGKKSKKKSKPVAQ